VEIDLRCMCVFPDLSFCGVGAFYFEKEIKRVLTQHWWPENCNDN